MNIVFDNEPNENAKNFHLRRIAFMIINEKILFLENSTMSHWQWANSLGLKFSKAEFNNIVRGFYLDGDIVFYKGNFTYDDECVEMAKKYCKQIKEHCKADKTKVWCGEIIGAADSIWKPDLFVCEI